MAITHCHNHFMAADGNVGERGKTGKELLQSVPDGFFAVIKASAFPPSAFFSAEENEPHCS